MASFVYWYTAALVRSLQREGTDRATELQTDERGFVSPAWRLGQLTVGCLHVSGPRKSVAVTDSSSPEPQHLGSCWCNSQTKGNSREPAREEPSLSLKAREHGALASKGQKRWASWIWKRE